MSRTCSPNAVLRAAALVRGEDDVLNELDENAIEAAVQLKEAEKTPAARPRSSP